MKNEKKKETSYLEKHLDIILKLFPYIWNKDVKIKRQYLIFFVFTLIFIFLNISFPLILKKVITLMYSNTNLNFPKILIYIVIYLFIWLGIQLFSVFREFVLLRIIERIVNFFCRTIIRHIHKLPYKFHVNKKLGETVSYLDKAYVALPNILWGFLLNIIPTVIEILCAIIIVWTFYGFLLGIILISFLLLFIIFSFVFAEATLKAKSLSNKSHFIASSYIVDGFLNFSLIKYFNNYDLEDKQIKNLLDNREFSEIYARKIGYYLRLGQIIIIFLCISLIILLAVNKIVISKFFIADFILINTYVFQFAMPLSLFGSIFKEMRKGFTDLESIFNLLKLKQINEPSNKNFKINNKCIIEFKNVSFKFYNKVKVLNNISFKLWPNKIIALVGSSGAGKSTISNLLFRFYTPSFGEILINGNNISTLNSNTLSKLIGIMPQNLNLFNNTIRYNLCYGNMNATLQDIKLVLKVVNLTDMINNLPLGLGTVIGESGLTLSSGEKQRVALARTLLKKSQVYIFDEATSHLDYLTEKHIFQSLKSFIKDSGFLIIAHRLASVRYADHIIVMDKGSIVEEGKHEELLLNNSYYFQLWKSQSSYFRY